MAQNALAERDELGATATEYGLIVGFIAFIIVMGVGFFGRSLDGYFGTLANWLSATL